MRFATVAIGLLVALAPRGAGADCGNPFVEFSPSSGALPPRPTVFVFVPHELDGGAFVAGDATLAVERIASDPIYDVWRVNVQADRARVTVRYIVPPSGEVLVAATYLVGATSAAHDARVVEVEHAESSWTCSHTNAIRIETHGDAAVLRFDWHDHGEPTIVPAGLPLLGFLSCFGWNALVTHERAFDLVAMFADGTERKLGTSTLQIDDDDARVPFELLPDPPRCRATWLRWLAISLLIAVLGATRLVRLPRA